MPKTEKIEIDYRKYKEQGEEVRKKIKEVFRVETRYAIIMVINNFGSMNIKKIAKMLNKNEATIYHHLQFLKEKPKLLEIDTEKTDSNKGIYYKLTKIARKNFGDPPVEVLETNLPEVFEKILNESDEDIARIYIDMLRNHPDLGNQTDKEKRSFAYNHMLEKILINNIQKAEQAFIDGKKPINKTYPMGSLANFPLDIKISRPRHHFEVLKLLTEMSAKFQRLGEKIKNEMDKEEVPEGERIDLHYHIVGGEIAEFEFE